MDVSVLRESSPDPLTQSWNSTFAMRPSLSPIKSSANTSPQKQKQALRQSSPNLLRSPSKQQRTLVFNSPGKTANKKGSVASSPWRIKVTVEAEEEDRPVESGRRGATTTTKVPLKGEDEHSPVKKRSSGSHAPTSRASKSSTPSTTARKERKGTPGRKRKQSTLIQDEITAVEEPEDIVGGEVQIASPSPAGKQFVKRQKSNDGHQASLSEAPAQKSDFLAYVPLHEKPENAHLLWKQDDVVCTPFGQERTATRKIRERIPTPRKPTWYDEESLSPVSLTSPGASQTSSHGNFLSADSAALVDDKSADLEDSLKSEDDVSSTMGGMEDDTRVLDQSLAESEGFSMVSIESLKSQRQIAEAESNSTPKLNNQNGLEQQNGKDRLNGLQDIRVAQHVDSLEINGDEHVQRAFQLDREPSTIQQRTPKTDSSETSATNMDDPFKGFGDETKRLLGTGLALGELLARGERGFVARQAAANNNDASARGDDIDSGNRRSQARLPTPSDSEAPLSSCASPNPQSQGQKSQDHNIQLSVLSEAANIPENLGSPSASSKMSWRPTTPTRVTPDPEPSHTRELEREWQREREEVIRQAEQANSSQIVYISSEVEPPKGNDMADEEYCDAEMTEAGDIWQEEAERSLEESITSQGSRISQNVGTESKILASDLKELLGEDTRPLRSKLPRTWRRTSGNHFLYSDEAESPARPSFPPNNLNLDHIRDNSKARSISVPFTQDESKEQVVLSRREDSPPKGILSSPERQRGSTPKEVRFARIEAHGQAENLDFPDAESFSAEDSPQSRISNGERNASIYGEQLYFSSSSSDSTSNLETSDIRQLQRELKSMGTPQGRVLAHTPNFGAGKSGGESNGVLVLKPDPNRTYAKLFIEAPQSQVQRARKAKSDPNLAKHIKSSRTITIVRDVASRSSPPQGIFSHFSAWLYPPVPPPEPQHTYTYDWNRNHYLLLNYFWERSHPAPYYIDAIPEASPSKEMNRQREPLPQDLENLVSARITRFNGQHALVLTRTHCTVAAQFITDASTRGIPLMCDGRRKVPKYIRKRSYDYDPANDSSDDDNDDDEEWPKRDASGRVVRCKQEWTAEEAVKGVYGLWLIKMRDAALLRAKQ